MLVTDAQANFHSDVYKMPRDDLSSTSSFISKPRIIGMDGQAGPLQKNNSNYLDAFLERQVDAFLQIAEANKL